VKKFAISIALLAVLAISVPFSHAQSNSKVPDKALMQKILDAWSTLDPQKAAEYYSTNPANVYFDIAPLKYKGWNEYQNGVTEIFKAYSSLKLTVNDDAEVHGSGKSAWATATFHLEGTHKDGSKESGEGRWTAVWEKSGDKWLIVHEHVSVPAPTPPAATAQGGGETKQYFLPRMHNWL
jgi:ketosteroid isomerase-like protein